MQPRSKSAQQKYNERPQRALRFHLDSFNSNIPLLSSFPQHQLEQRMPITYPKTNFMWREPMPKAESSELVAMVKMKTAIDELQALATSNQNSSKKHDQLRQAYRRFPNRESQLYGELQENWEAAAKEETSNEEVNESMQYYKLDNEGLKQQLQQQMSKNLDYFILIRKMETRNSQLQHQIGILLRKRQTDQESKDQRIRQLQQEVKQQIIINLELQQLLLSRKMRQKDINQNQNQSLTIKQMKVELIDLKESHRRQINCYIKAIDKKNQQIHQLQQSLKLMEQKGSYVPFTFKKIQQPINSPQMLDKFPLNSEKASPPYFTSTNPSIQQAENRKKTDSVSSKEYNCLCLGNLSLKTNEKRVVCKTDRP